MPKKLVILCDRSGLSNHLINAGDRALTHGLYRLLKRHWHGSVHSGGWKNFPYFSMRALPAGADEKTIRRLFDRWGNAVDNARPGSGERQGRWMALWKSGWLMNNAFVARLDRRVRERQTRGIVETVAPYLLRNAFRHRFKTLIDEADVVVFNGGGLIADHLAPFVPGYLFEIYYAHRKGKRVVTLNQTVSVRNRVLQSMVATVYRDLDLHIVREPLSKEMLVGLGVPSRRVHVAPDTAFAVERKGDLPIGRQAAGNGDRGPFRVAITPRGDRHLHIPFWSAICKWILGKKNCRLYAVHTCKAHDQRLIKCLRDRFPLEEIDCKGDYHQIIDTLGCFHGLVSDRYHAVIFGMLAGIPVIGLKSTTFKIDGLFQLSNYPLDTIDMDGSNAVSKTQHHIDSIFANRNALDSRMAEIRQKMCTSVDDAYAILRHV